MALSAFTPELRSVVNVRYAAIKIQLIQESQALHCHILEVRMRQAGIGTATGNPRTEIATVEHDTRDDVPRMRLRG